MRVPIAIHVVVSASAFVVPGRAVAQLPAKPQPGEVRQVSVTATVEPERGFVDDPMEFDGASGRLLYVNSDAGDLCRLEVLDLTQSGAKLLSVDLAPITHAPEEVHFAPSGNGFVVIYRAGGTGAGKAAVFLDHSGRVVHKFGPATDVVYTQYDGQPAIVGYTTAERRVKGRVVTRHTVDARNLHTGKRIGKKTSFDADDTGTVKRLGFRIQYWRGGYTQAIGIKEGTWDRKENQRSPDQSATYDVVAQAFTRIAPIRDLIAHAEQTQIYSEEQNRSHFARIASDRSGVVLHEGEHARPVVTEEEFSHYDPATLRYQPARGGGMFFSLAIDPVHPDAVARKKADDPWLDLYFVGKGEAKAVRVARLLLGKRKIGWRASRGHWAVIEKHIGFSRGGKKLVVYELESFSTED